jgi:hypothetical protein
VSLIREPLVLPFDPGDKHQAASRGFIAGIRDRNRIVLNPFNIDVWGQGAESTLIQSNRTTQHPRLTQADLAAVTRQVWKMFSQVQPEDFDCVFFKLAFAIRQAHLPFMTFGRAQKFINILCKYSYCYYWSGVDPAWNAANPWVRDLSPFFHIPVDAIVLGNLRLESPAWFKRITSSSAVPPKPPYARFQHGANTEGWSILDRTYPYIAVQQYVLDNLRSAVTPMHREMRDLWP